MNCSYQKYKIPPNFHLSQLHARSCRLYMPCPPSPSPSPSPSCPTQIQKCLCCNRLIGTQSLSLCSYVSSFHTIAEQVPIFFNFINLTILLCVLLLFMKIGEMLFLCSQCRMVQYHEDDLWGWKFRFRLGFVHQNALLMMVQVILYSIVLLMIKINLKIKKYRYRSYNFAIQKRSVQLINLPKNSTQADIRNMFKDHQIESVEFTYQVRQYHQWMTKVAKIKKSLRYLHSRIMREDDENIKQLQRKLQISNKHLNEVLAQMKNQKKRLQVAYVVFSTPSQRNKVLKHHSYCFLSKIILKIFPCCSNNNIRGQHVTVESAPAPEDIQWQNLQNPYYQTKAFRMSSLLICITMLIFGLASQAIVFNTQNSSKNTNGSIRQVISSLVIFVINFLIVNFLEFSTQKMEAHLSNTRIKLSLIRKITFFMFLNVSICPFLAAMYNRIVNQASYLNLLDNITFTILIVSVGNMFKPFLTLWSLKRMGKWFKRRKEKSKGDQSDLNQLEANELFEPIEFPIEVFYSLLHASIMMCFFYLGCLQFLVILELFSLLLLYFISKWMLLKVCKQPRGLSLKLSNLAQSLMRFYVPLYWLGKNLTLVLVYPQEHIDLSWAIKKMVYEDTYQIVSTGIVVFMLFCESFVSFIASKLSKKNSGELLESCQEIEQNRTYSQANLFFKIHEQGMMQNSAQKKRPKRNKQDNQKSTTLLNRRLI